MLALLEKEKEKEEGKEKKKIGVFAFSSLSHTHILSLSLSLSAVPCVATHQQREGSHVAQRARGDCGYDAARRVQRGPQGGKEKGKKGDEKKGLHEKWTRTDR